MSERFDYTKDTKWVVFGGSYSCALAAWFGQLHPELVFAAVGSSGPLQSVIDFYQYLDVVKDSLASFDTQCSNDLEIGLQQLESHVTSLQGQKNMSHLFDICNIKCKF